MQALYGALFEWIVARVNSMLSIDAKFTDDDVFVAILDIFGFEKFQVNSFEQLLINYANEKLHDAVRMTTERRLNTTCSTICCC